MLKPEPEWSLSQGVFGTTVPSSRLFGILSALGLKTLEPTLALNPV